MRQHSLMLQPQKHGGYSDYETILTGDSPAVAGTKRKILMRALKRMMIPDPLWRTNWKTIHRPMATAQVGRVSPRPQDHRQPIAPFSRMVLPVVMVLCLMGCGYVLGPAVSERHALPARPPDTTKNHVLSVSDATLC